MTKNLTGQMIAGEVLLLLLIKGDAAYLIGMVQNQGLPSLSNTPKAGEIYTARENV